MFFYKIRFTPNPAGGHIMAFYRDNNDRVTISYNQMKGVLENHNFLSEKHVISIDEYYYGIGNNMPRDEEGHHYITGRSMLIREINPEVQTVKVTLRPGFGHELNELVAFNDLPELVTEHFESPNLDRPDPPPPQNGGRRRRSTRRRRYKRRNRSYRRRR